MKITILCANYTYSFFIQAEGLQQGFSERGVDCRLHLISTTDPIAELLAQDRPDAVISIGNWTDYEMLVTEPARLGYKTIPWMVCDDHAITRFVDEFNGHGLLVTPSEHCKANFARSGIKPEFISVIPEAVDPKKWYESDAEETEKLLSFISTPNPNAEKDLKYDIRKIKKDGTPIIFTTGGDATKKGAQEVMRALASLDRSIPWIYVIKTWAFPVIFEKSLEELRLAESLGIFDRVKYIVGDFSQDFMRALVSLSDIYASPSRYEGFGLPLVEVQLCGKPVVTIAATSTQETVLHGITGFHAKKESLRDGSVRADIEDLAQYLKKLILNPELRKTMGSAAKKHAYETYRPEIIADMFLALIS